MDTKLEAHGQEVTIQSVAGCTVPLTFSQLKVQFFPRTQRTLASRPANTLLHIRLVGAVCQFQKELDWLQVAMGAWSQAVAFPLASFIRPVKPQRGSGPCLYPV